ncbi:MAG: S8 family serine peptidase [Acidobacteriota bacterium]|nr:S8 family serine peptidase [Acidobacteriota bacterium]
MPAVYRKFNPSKPIARLTATVLMMCAGIHGQSVTASSGSPQAIPQNVVAVKLVLTQQADVSGAFQLTTKAQRGQYVYDVLTQTAQQSQASLLEAVNQMGLIGNGFYIANFVLVQAPAGTKISTTQLQQLVSRPEVSTAESVYSFNTQLPGVSLPPITSLPLGRGLEKNLAFINAPAVWAQGAQGQGITIGVVDSGVQWDHRLLKGHYRGLLGTGANHNYNWWDAVHTTFTGGTNPCGVSSAVPCDDLGHGTHVTGAAVGGNFRDYQIGVAPEARFMACRDMDRGYASTGTAFEECMQFMLAPWNLQGQNPDPSKAPDLVVHPYHCYASGANCIDDPVMHAVYWNLYAAGITSIVAGEDSGAICNSLTNWPQNYAVAITAGALGYDPDSGMPLSTLASYSNAGPGNTATIFRPDIAAPGTQILSAVPGGNVAPMSGTSVAAAQLAGAFALVLSVRPTLQGRPEQMWRLVSAAIPQWLQIGTCGSPASSPNYLYGWGNLDVSAMLAMANTQ